MSDPQELDLLSEAQAGDARALEALLRRHQAHVYRFAMKMCHHPDDAQDVVQETLLAMARGLREFRGASSVSTWLYSIARSHCIKKRRRSKFAPARDENLDALRADPPADPGRNPEEAFADQELERSLERAIAALEPEYREILVLRDVEGLSAAEVAEVTGLSVAAVKSRLHRARLVVRAELAPFLPPPDEAAPGSCPDVLSLFSRHVEGDVSAEVCAEMERHLQGCPRCRGACDSLRQTLSLCRTGGAAVEVPAEVQSAVRVAVRTFLEAPRSA